MGNAAPLGKGRAATATGETGLARKTGTSGWIRWSQRVGCRPVPHPTGCVRLSPPLYLPFCSTCCRRRWLVSLWMTIPPRRTTTGGQGHTVQLCRQSIYSEGMGGGGVGANGDVRVRK